MVVLTGTLPAQAADYWSPRTAGLGGSGHAAPLLNDTIYLNPAFGSFLPTYSVALNYLKSNVPGRNYNVSLQDGRTELFQAGVGYTLREDAGFIHVGASKSFLARTGVGVGAKFFMQNGQSTGTDTTLSIAAVPIDWITATLIVDNLFQTEAGKAHGLYREIVVGTKFNLESIVLAYFDPHWAPDAPVHGGYGFEAGLEFVLMADLFFRLGAFHDANIPWLTARGRGYSTGIGWVTPRMSLDYAISRALEPRNATAHTLGATLYF